MKMSKTEKLYNHLFLSEAEMTIAGIRKRFGLKDVPSAIRRLRKKGACIYTLRSQSGKTYYVLGQPSSEMVRTAMAAFGAKIFQEKI